MKSSTLTTSVEKISPAKTTRLLLRLIYAAQPISRIEISRRLDVNRSTVTDIIKPLLKSMVLREEPLRVAPETSQSQGRPPVGISFSRSENIFAGVNLGVHHSQIGITDLSGEILAETDFATPDKPDAALLLIREKIAGLCALSSDRKLMSIGVSVPGPTDPSRRCLLYAPHLGWKNVSITETLQKSSGSSVNVIVENDATAAAMYEMRLKIGSSNTGSMPNFILIRSGTGIGVGLVIDNEVYRGAGRSQGISGEFGHMTIVADGKSCVCGNQGCWEKYAAASAAATLYMGERMQLGNTKPPRFIEIVERAEGGEIRAQRTLERLGKYLGIGIANVIIGVGLSHIIVSGRLVYGWKFIKEPLREAVGKSMAGKLGNWTIECGAPKGSAIGGALEVSVQSFLEHGLGSDSKQRSF